MVLSFYIDVALTLSICFTYYCTFSGDHVYVRSQDDKPYIARIDKLWTDNR